MYKILVLGNGFDLACGLPTKYTDFLKFLKYIAPKRDNSERIGLDERIESLVKDILDERYEEIEPYINMIPNNVWVQHFFCVEQNLPENRKWMDFEAEMARVVRTLDDYKNKQFAEDPMSTDNDRMVGFPLRLENYPWARFFSEETYKSLFNLYLYDDYQNNREKSYKDLIDMRHKRGGFLAGSMDRLFDLKLQSYSDIREALLSDLKDLIRLLNYYLREYVSKLDIKPASVAPQIIDALCWFKKESDSDKRMIMQKMLKITTFSFTLPLKISV